MKLGNPEDMHKYEDMLNLPHPISLRHPHMAISDRAAQFAPFAALTGHNDAIKKTAQTAYEKIEFKEEETMAPEIDKSTREERENYIKKTFWCRGDCDNCGICQIYGGTDPLIIFEDYINGKKTFLEISKKYR
jgi:hypothetical protein